MVFQLSPGVAVLEFDTTTVVPAVSTSVGAYVGYFDWGPCDSRILVDSENTLVTRFNRPSSNSYQHFFTASNFLVYGNKLQLVRSVGANALNATVQGGGLLIKNRDVYEASYYAGQDGGTHGEFAARYPGDIGNSLYISLCPSAQAWSDNVTASNSQVNVTTFSTNTTIIFSANVIPNGVSAGDLVSVDGNNYYQLLTLASTGLTGTIGVGGIVLNGGSLKVPTAVANNNNVPLLKKWAYQSLFPGAPGTSVQATTKGGANDEVHVVVLDKNGLFKTGGSQANNVVLEVYPYLSKASDAINNDGTSAYYPTVLHDKSKYVWWLSHPAAGTNWGNTIVNTSFTNVKGARNAQLTSGATSQPTDGDLENSWSLFANPDVVDVSLLLTGAASTTLGNWIIQNIAQTRLDCVAFVSPQQSDVVNNSGSEVTSITTTRNLFGSTSYAFMDCNWKYQYDRYNNVYRWLPCNPDIAGLCVRTDNTRDPWWSPAGFNRGGISNAVKLAWNPAPADRDTLYPIGVNPVVAFPGQGVVLYGDKTMQTKPSAFDRINVRRLFIVLEKAIAVAAKYSLFEFNDEFTRAAFVNMVEPFLRDVKGRRGIYDFRVVCDTTNNTPQVIDGNRFVGDIYIKPARSINFIQLNFVAVGTGVDFNEIAGQFGA